MFDIFYIQLDHPHSHSHSAIHLCWFTLARSINFWHQFELSTFSLDLPFYKLDSLREFQIKLTKAAII
jgi:hypothetical protein